MIIPALLESKLASLNTKIELFEDVSPLIHVDFGDGYFVELKSEFTVEDISNLTTKAKLQVHLMCINPEDQLQVKYDTIKSVIFHAEAVENYLNTARVFKSLGYEVGVCVNLQTPAPDYFENIDFIQFMSVIPGKQHNLFESAVVQKIYKFHKLFPSVSIQVDGGLNPNTIHELSDSGASNFAVGSYILTAEHPIQTYKELCGI
ncbi:MAG: hypothetical protein RLY61_189 [Candidatus Parcubacteria bacterium]|jgi:ribulose-phosphate 3-epimerase